MRTHCRWHESSSRASAGLALWVCAALLVAASGADATTVVLTDLNSQAQVSLDQPGGMFSWSQDGVDHLYQQWFWYRIGPSGGEKSIHELGGLSYSLSDADFDPGEETLTVRYASQDLLVEVIYTLQGGTPGSGGAAFTESITISNLSGLPMELHFFQYCDFGLGGTASGDVVEMVSPNTVQQRDGTRWVVSETVVTPTPSRVELAYYASTLASLSDSDPTTLANTLGPVGPGDVTWAFQWDFSLGADSTVLISKGKAITEIIPEPLTVLGVFGAVAGLGAYLRGARRRAA